MLQYYRPSLHLSHKQHWICYVFRTATCRFSKLSGPVRYIPKVRKQSPPQRQVEHANSCLNHPIDDVGTSMHARKLPSEAQQGVTDSNLVDRGHLGIQDKAFVHARSGSCLNEENDMCIASVHESRETCSSEVLGAQMSSKHVPASSPHSLDRGGLLDSSYHLNKNKERSEPIPKEERTVQPAYVRLQNAASCKGKSARQSSSAYLAEPTLPTHVMQRGKRDAEDMLQTREKDLLSVKAERKAFLQAAEESTLQGKHLKKKEADIQGRNPLPWQDAESFLLKVQRAKQRSLEPFGMPYTAATEDRDVDVNDDIIDRDFSDDEGFMLLEQETLEQSKYVHGASKWLDSYSRAEQEHAKNQAVRYLSMRPYTAALLRKKLIGRSIAPGLADYAVATVQSCGLQSDIAYAETFSFARFNYRGWGPQKIKLGLKQRGITDEIIEAAIDRVFCQEEGNIEQDETLEDDDSRSNVANMSKVAMDHLLAQATKQWNRGKTTTIDTKTRRMVSWLQYRGFTYSVIKYVLNHLRKQVPIEDEL